MTVNIVTGSILSEAGSRITTILQVRNQQDGLEYVLCQEKMPVVLNFAEGMTVDELGKIGVHGTSSITSSSVSGNWRDQ